ncbi:growth hormone secretagogue receptor type 1-like [Argopecten irradians]|uniref:growth hormone secretagogue receptor type 1-like n=1 Tax=Argopecten irradians TaxID=31199 RepID=UPI003715CC5E
MDMFGTNSILSSFNDTTDSPRGNFINVSQDAVENVSWNNTAWLNTSTEAPVMADDDILLKILEVLQHANYVLLPTFLLLGLTGNCLTVIIMTGRRYAHLTSRLLLIALAVSDSVLLLTQPLNKIFVIELTGIDLRAFSDVGCKIYFVLFKTGKMTSSWFVVLLCFERFVAVWFPFRAKAICTQRNTILSIICVYAVIGTYNSVWSPWSTIINDRCHPDAYNASDPEDKAAFGRFLVWGCSLYSFIPTVIMMILTPLIIKKLLEHKKKRKAIASIKKKVEETKITAMLLGIVTAYIILILPVTFLHITSFLIGVKAFGENPNGFLIFRDVTQILEQVNYAINFFLYVTTSQQFRKGLVDLLSCKKMGKPYMSRIGTNKTSSQKKLNGSMHASLYSGSSDSDAGSRSGITAISNLEKQQFQPESLPGVAYP